VPLETPILLHDATPWPPRRRPYPPLPSCPPSPLGLPDRPDQAQNTDDDHAPEEHVVALRSHNDIVLTEDLEDGLVVGQDQADDEQADHVHHLDQRG